MDDYGQLWTTMGNFGQHGGLRPGWPSGIVHCMTHYDHERYETVPAVGWAKGLKDAATVAGLEVMPPAACVRDRFLHTDNVTTLLDALAGLVIRGDRPDVVVDHPGLSTLLVLTWDGDEHDFYAVPYCQVGGEILFGFARPALWRLSARMVRLLAACGDRARDEAA